MNKRIYPKILLGVFAIIWIALAITPSYRDVWIVENILPVLLVIFLIVTYKYFQFSNTSYTLLFIFLILHTIGAHYTYARMPLFTIIQNQFALSRNHYDRVVHFLFGLLFYLPIYEFISIKLKVKGLWAHLLTILSISAAKCFHEVLQYFYALAVETDRSYTLFLGAQGDVWDAQRDMLLGTIGAVVASIITAIKNKIQT